VVKPGLLEVDHRSDPGTGAQNVRRAEVAVDELRRRPISWCVGNQPPQGVTSRLRQMFASGVEPVSDTGRQRLRSSLRRDDLIGVRVGRKRVMKPRQHRAGGLYLPGIINVEKVPLNHSLEAHRDLVDLHLKTAVQCLDRRGHRQPVAVKPMCESSNLRQAREPLRGDRPFRK
jgi:hypothetical protein